MNNRSTLAIKSPKQISISYRLLYMQVFNFLNKYQIFYSSAGIVENAIWTPRLRSSRSRGKQTLKRENKKRRRNKQVSKSSWDWDEHQFQRVFIYEYVCAMCRYSYAQPNELQGWLRVVFRCIIEAFIDTPISTNLVLTCLYSMSRTLFRTPNNSGFGAI